VIDLKFGPGGEFVGPLPPTSRPNHAISIIKIIIIKKIMSFSWLFYRDDNRMGQIRFIYTLIFLDFKLILIRL
jgi:hypothetical protein